jgi:dTDP-4-dehydrorhamnose 3,5-epimerase
MIFHKTDLKDAFVIDLEKIEDERGFFARAWCMKEFEAQGLTARTVHNKTRGTTRGMHYQIAPYEEAKLVRCMAGSIYDVIIDLRSGSETYRSWFGVELTAANRRMLFVPEGFAHGFQTLEDDTEVTYQVSQFYTPGSERGIRWDDPAFSIDWPIEVQVISDKDKSWPDFVYDQRG